MERKKVEGGKEEKEREGRLKGRKKEEEESNDTEQEWKEGYERDEG